MKEYHTKNRVHFELELHEEYIQKNMDRLYSIFKLSNKISLRNLVGFNSRGAIRKYDSIQQIISEFFEIRLLFYRKRKEYLLSRLERDVQVLDMKVRFVQEVIQ